MKNLKPTFDYIKINLASPQRIKEWGTRNFHKTSILGCVIKPDTMHYRTGKPEKDGLFCETIFGPITSWKCSCGKYNGKNSCEFNVCEICNVEITESRVRRYKMGFITLFYPVTHIWYLKGIPSYLSIILKKKVHELEKIVYFNTIQNIVTTKELKQKKFLSNSFLNKGTETIKMLLSNINLKTEITKDRIELNILNFKLKKKNTQKKTLFFYNLEKNIKRNKLIRRIRLMENFLATKTNPTWMVLDLIPVLPPELRPMVPLESGNFVTSDITEIYQQVITRNNRLGDLLSDYCPSSIIENEKRLLQESIDLLIDNSKKKPNLLNSNNKELKSLSSILPGKFGLFRQNLLGKRVDYSGRSVIVVGPNLKLHQCGLPHEIALELFRPFLVHKLLSIGIVKTFKEAEKIIEKGGTIIWNILKNILRGRAILLNRAPTLHRLGIQAFEPILIYGQTIQVHPLVCMAFNADFDGDQMAIHLPLSYKAQKEAQSLMLSPNNFLSPATGDPIVTPSQDMVLGCYYLTVDNPINWPKKNKYFSNYHDVLLAYQQKKISLQTPIWVKSNEIQNSTNQNPHYIKNLQIEKLTKIKYFRTTPGRIILNTTLVSNLTL